MSLRPTYLHQSTHAQSHSRCTAGLLRNLCELSGVRWGPRNMAGCLGQGKHQEMWWEAAELPKPSAGRQQLPLGWPAPSCCWIRFCTAAVASFSGSFLGHEKTGEHLCPHFPVGLPQPYNTMLGAFQTLTVHSAAAFLSWLVAKQQRAPASLNFFTPYWSCQKYYWSFAVMWTSKDCFKALVLIKEFDKT